MRLAAFALAALVVVTGCTDSDPEPLSWSQVELPGGLDPVTVTATSRGLLVGAYDGAAATKPQLLLRTGSTWASVPVTADAHWAKQGRWKSVSVLGDRIVAVASEVGGAHFNPRWTTWEGGFDGVRDYPQTVETFGGWRSGGLRGVVPLEGEPVVVGSWIGDSGVPDIGLWSLAEHVWTRASSTGTPLAGTQSAIVSVRSMASADTDPDAGVVLVGSVTEVGGGTRLRPTWWHGTGTWQRESLPGGAGEALGVGCSPEHCLLGGYDESGLALWSVRANRATRLDDVPGLEVGSGSTVTVSPAADALLVSSGDASTLVSRDGDEWRTSSGPAGRPSGWVEVDSTWFVTTVTADGSMSLWRATPGGKD